VLRKVKKELVDERLKECCRTGGLVGWEGQEIQETRCFPPSSWQRVDCHCFAKETAKRGVAKELRNWEDERIPCSRMMLAAATSLELQGILARQGILVTLPGEPWSQQLHGH
jgi:hypothetical protein